MRGRTPGFELEPQEGALALAVLGVGGRVGLWHREEGAQQKARGPQAAQPWASAATGNELPSTLEPARVARSATCCQKPQVDMYLPLSHALCRRVL